MSGVTLWRYSRKFEIGGVEGLVRVRLSTAGLFSELYLDGMSIAQDQTPPAGPNAVRNHKLAATLAERDLLIGCAIAAMGVLSFYVCYLGGRGIGSLIFS
jgi:hypothetical protein